MATKADGRKVLEVPAEPGVPTKRQLANIALDPLTSGALIAAAFSKGTYGESDLVSMIEALHDRAKAIRDNKLDSVEDMLTGQAAALNAMFLELARRSGANMGEYIQAAETYMRLALKAQAQCRATLETLANDQKSTSGLCQAGEHRERAAAGEQRRGRTSPASEPRQAPPNELLETEYGKRLEPGTAGAAIGGDPALETVGAVDRSPDGGWQGTRQPQRRQGRKAHRA